MSKRLLLIASSCFLFFSVAKNAKAQTDINLFNLPDTVCADHMIVPTNVVDGAQNYNWSFCPPNLDMAPEGSNTGVMGSLNDVKSIVLAEDDSIYFAFVLNGNGVLTRYRYLDGYAGQPTLNVSMGNIQRPGGMCAVKTDIWHLFVIADSGVNAHLVRFDFENGLKAMPVQSDLGDLGGQLNRPKHLFIGQNAGTNGKWFGFSFSKDDELLKMSFGTDLMDTPTVANMGNIDSSFSGVTAIAGIEELGNWHLFITNKNKNNIDHLSFGNSLDNTPFVIDLGDMNSRIKAPVGIAITKACDAYYGFVLNLGTASFVTLKWDDQSIANQPTAVNHGNVAGFVQPQLMSGIVSDEGSLYMFAGNDDESLSKIVFPTCPNSTIATSEQQYPPAFSYDEPGTYSVFLTINQGLPQVQTYCRQITISSHPPITVSNDTLMCQGDTIKLSILTLGTDSFLWTPDYNINDVEGQFIKVWPDYSTKYAVTAYFADNCIVTTPVNVTVSKIVADAGPDRILSDGSATMLGGAKTTTGIQYTYLWTPDIGITGSTGTPVTEAVPPYDLTYYLHVSNTDGCHAIDSAIVSTPCDKINLPNAFVPASNYPGTNRFGLVNQQLAKINYFKIFDRWGQEVFSTTDPKGSWDGTVDGTPAPMGVYVWEVDANCANTHKRYRQSGTVTLIR